MLKTEKDLQLEHIRKLLGKLDRQEQLQIRYWMNRYLMDYRDRYVCPFQADELVEYAIDRYNFSDKKKAEIIEKYAPEMAEAEFDAEYGVNWEAGEYMFHDIIAPDFDSQHTKES